MDFAESSAVAELDCEDDPQPPAVDAMSLNVQELAYELEKRGVQPKGFFADDAKALQEFLVVEHAEALKRLKRERVEARTRAIKQSMIQRKRLIMEKELQEEEQAVANSSIVSHWLALIRGNRTPRAAHLECINSVTARTLAKAMCSNRNLHTLDLSHNQLNDNAGIHLANMLKRNHTLVKLEFDFNLLGPGAASAFAAALRQNKTLSFLSFDSNPLTDDRRDFSGISALAETLTASNRTLTTLNLWKTGLTNAAGLVLADALDANTTMLFLETGNNDVGQAVESRIADRLDTNKQRAQTLRTEIMHERARARVAEEEARAKAEADQKQRELEEWIEMQKQIRFERRGREREEEELKAKEELAAREAEWARKEKERKEREEDAAGKKGKKKKGKKKKK